MQQTSYRHKLTKYDLPPTPHFERDDYLSGDFDAGTLTTTFGTRVIVLPEELIRGLHEALEFETGRAWSIVCYSCGRNWGARLMQMMQNEWREHHRQRGCGEELQQRRSVALAVAALVVARRHGVAHRRGLLATSGA